MTPPSPVSKAITFLYYRDLAQAEALYRDRLGMTLAIDQGWSKIFRITDGAYVGLVDSARGMNSWQEAKCVQLCLRVPDVDQWYEWARSEQLPALSDMFENEGIGIRAFVFNDPEGYQIEVQSPTRAGA